MLKSLQVVFARDIETLRTEVALYPSDALLWQVVPGCPNPGGNLVLHLVGNLRHFIGAQLGSSGYVRNRPAEFSTTGLTRAELHTSISLAATEVAHTLETLDPARLQESFSLPQHSGSVTIERWLLHLATHLAFHIGQLDYHRRAVTGDRSAAGALSLEPLFRA
jgi:hypothetical protein